MVIRPIIDNRRTFNFWSLSFMFFIKSIRPPGPYRPLKRKMTEQIWCMMDDGAFMWLRVMELMIRSWVDFQLRKASPIVLWISVAVWNGEPASSNWRSDSDEMSDGKIGSKTRAMGWHGAYLSLLICATLELDLIAADGGSDEMQGCVHISRWEKQSDKLHNLCVRRQPERSHVWPGGCGRRDPSSCSRAVKWSRWRAAEEDIIQRLIILSGSRRAWCFAGCRRWWWGGGPRPNIRCHSQRQWMDNGHPSIFHASLSHGLEPTTMSISKQFDPFSWLIHQPDLICNPDRFPEESRVGFRGEDEHKNIESEGEPMTSGPKYCSEHSRWAMVFISVPRWLIYFIDGLFISQPWTDMYLSSWREV